MGTRTCWRAVLVAMVVGAVLAPALPVVPVAGKGKSKRPPAPLPGWVLDRARFEPLDAATIRVSDAGEYRGSIEAVRPPGGGLTVINDVSLDDYVRGISEVPAAWPIEAQKAQAIAARTYALHEMERKVTTSYRAAGADICATQACQVYTGVVKERSPGGQAWLAAVEATRGQALYYRNRPILAKYSSSNGGVTVAGGQPYLRATPDPDDRQSPLHQWKAAYPLADVGRAIGLPGVPVDVYRAGDDVVATVLDPEGNPTDQRLPAADFRARLNDVLPAPAGLPLPVPSNRFGAGTAGGVVVVDGRGWGHGIGLSQFGALGKALRGMKAPDILAAYYSGIRPVARPPEQLPAQIRVAVVVDGARAVIGDDAGRFRITDGQGAVIAHSASGAWSVFAGPKGRGIRVVPPRDQAGPATAELAATDPGVPAPGGPLSATIRLGGPAAVTRVQLSSPDGSTQEIDPPALRPAGEVALPVAGVAAAGTYTLAVERDAGAGRTTSHPLVIEVAPSPPAMAVGPRPGPQTRAGPGVLQVGAFSLLVAVGALLLALRRPPAGPLH